MKLYQRTVISNPRNVEKFTEVDVTAIPWCKTHNSQRAPGEPFECVAFAYHRAVMGFEHEDPCQLEDQAVYRIQLSNIDSEVSHE